jgi:hypothetical protein
MNDAILKQDAQAIQEPTTYHVEVFHDWDVFQNGEHPKVKPLAEKYGMKHNGGGMWMGPGSSGRYGNGYYTTDEAAARDFEKAVHAVGLSTEEDVPPQMAEVIEPAKRKESDPKTQAKRAIEYLNKVFVDDASKYGWHGWTRGDITLINNVARAINKRVGAPKLEVFKC